MCALFSRISAQANSMSAERADPPVEVVVEPVEALAVARRHRRRLLGEQRVEAGELGGAEPLGRHPHRLDLERGADEARLPHRLLGDRADLGRALRPDGQEAELRQPPEGVAHRLARHAGGRATSASDSRAPGGSASVTTCR